MNSSKGGFTIVELLVVIVIIGILAMVSVFAYRGVTDYANDNVRRVAIKQVSDGIKLLAVKKPFGTIIGGGSAVSPLNEDGMCPNGTSGGWIVIRDVPGINAGTFNPGTYQCSMMDMLLANKYLPADFLEKLLPNEERDSGFVSSMMLYSCYGSGGKRLALMYYLKNPTAEETAKFDNRGTVCSNLAGTAFRDSYRQKAIEYIDI
ncbi:MAG: type II secretion system protein [Psychrobacter sp.]